MSMMTSQILKFVDFTKAWKRKYLEKESLFFLQIKKYAHYILKTDLGQITVF